MDAAWPKIAWVAATAVVLIATSVAAQQTEFASVDGRLVIASASIDGSTTIDTEGGVLQLGHERAGASATLNGSFRQVEVSWARIDCKGAGLTGGSGGSPFFRCTNSDEGSRTFRTGDFLFNTDQPEANLLASLEGSAQRFTAETTSDVAGSDGSAWRSGMVFNVTSNPGAKMLHDERIPAGTPVVSGSGHVHATWVGNSTVYVWGGTVTIQPEDGQSAEFRSGLWFGNVTGSEVDPDGVARDEHRQFVVLRFADATVDATVLAGPWRSASTETAATTTGTFLLRDARGTLASPEGDFRLEGDQVRIAGLLTGEFSGFSEDDGLSMNVWGSQVSLATASAGFQPAPTGSARAPSVLAWIGLPLLGAAVVGSIWGFRQWRSMRAPAFVAVERAEGHLFSGRADLALTEAERALTTDPSDAQALFLVGTSLIKLGRFREASIRIKDFEGADADPGLAYLLALSHMTLEEFDEAVDWATKAAQDAEFRASLLRDRTFAPLHELPAFRRRVGFELDPAFG